MKFYCHECNAQLIERMIPIVRSKTYCEECLREEFRKYDRDEPECEYCGQTIDSEGYWNIHGDVICDDCFDEEFREDL